MSPVTGQCVGIDISEDFLDVHLHPEGKEMRLRLTRNASRPGS